MWCNDDAKKQPLNARPELKKYKDETSRKSYGTWNGWTNMPRRQLGIKIVMYVVLVFSISITNWKNFL